MKDQDAFKTISEVAESLELPQHVLRFWETRFKQIKPLKRGGNRRYYRPADVNLLTKIKYLLYGQGYTIRGVQKIFKEKGARFVSEMPSEMHVGENNKIEITENEIIQPTHAMPVEDFIAGDSTPPTQSELTPSDWSLSDLSPSGSPSDLSPSDLNDTQTENSRSTPPAEIVKDILTELLDCKRLLDLSH